jgi:HEAT repeat protein
MNGGAVILRTKDGISLVGLGALGEIGTLEAVDFLRSLSNHPSKIIRDEIQRILEREGSQADTLPGPSSREEKSQ